MKGKLLLLFLFLPIPAIAAELSITMDDFSLTEQTMLSAKERNRKILAALANHHLKAALFVVGKYIKSQDDEALLRAWGGAGHLIGNHTFTHPNFNKTSLADFEDEAKACDAVLRPFPGFTKLFRYPNLAEGDTPAKRDGMRAWLKREGYGIGAVTIDASDWYIDERLREKLAVHPHADLKPYRDYYLAHIWNRAQYYDGLSKQLLGRSVKHTLLVHFNLLNALFLEDLLRMFEGHGWKLVDAAEAFRDPVFREQPRTMPSGQSLLWALAKASGKFEGKLRYPGEDDTYEKPAMDKLGL